MFFLRRRDVFGQDFVMGGTASRPQIHFSIQFAVEVRPEIGVRQKKDLPIGRQTGDQFFRIAAGAAKIDLGLGRGRGVHVGDDQSIGMGFAVVRDLLGRGHVRHRTPRVRIGMQHDRLRRKYLRGLRHKADAAENDHRSLTLRRLAGKFQRVADKVRDILDFRPRIIVRQYQRVMLLFQPDDLLFQRHRIHSSIFLIHYHNSNVYNIARVQQKSKRKTLDFLLFS